MKKLIAALALTALCQTAQAQVPGLVAPNQVLAGPTSGGTSQPAVGRTLITQDLPNPLTLQQIINLNATALPAATTGTLLEGGNADTVNSLFELSSFGAIPEFNGRRGNGTNASPTTLVNTNQISALTGSGYDGTGWSAVAASFGIYAEGTWSNTSHPTEDCLATTPAASITVATGLCQHQDKGVTLGTPTGGDEGANTINAAGAIYVNGVQVAAFPVATRAGDVIYWSGSAWTNFAGNNSGTNCFGENAVGAPQWSACSGGGGGSPGGSSGQIQYNAAGSFGGLSFFTTNGTNIVALSADNGVLVLNDPSPNNDVSIQFQSSTTPKWTIDSGTAATTNGLRIYDQVAGRADVLIASNGNMQLMPSAGAVTVGTPIGGATGAGTAAGSVSTAGAHYTPNLIFNPASGATINAQFAQTANVLKLSATGLANVASFNLNYYNDPVLTTPDSGSLFNLNSPLLYATANAFRIPLMGPVNFYDGTSFIADNPASSTAWQANTIGAYCSSEALPNATLGTGGGDCVSYWAVGYSSGTSAGGVGTGSGAWAMNSATSDDPVFSSGGYSSTPGRTAEGAETDLYTFHPDSIISGFDTVNSRFIAETTGESIAFWAQANQVNSLIGWTYGVRIDDGAATYGLSLGAAAQSGTSVASQYVLMDYFNASAAASRLVARAVPSGTSVGFQLSTTSGSAFIGVNGVNGVTCSGTPTSSFQSQGGIVTHC